MDDLTRQRLRKAPQPAPSDAGATHIHTADEPFAHLPPEQRKAALACMDETAHDMLLHDHLDALRKYLRAAQLAIGHADDELAAWTPADLARVRAFLYADGDRNPYYTHYPEERQKHLLRYHQLLDHIASMAEQVAVAAHRTQDALSQRMQASHAALDGATDTPQQ